MARKKSPGGVKLEDIIASLKKNQMDIPENIQKIIDENPVTKKVRGRKSVVETPDTNTKPKEEKPTHDFTFQGKELNSDPVEKTPVPESTPVESENRTEKMSPVELEKARGAAKKQSRKSNAFVRGFVKNFFGKDIANKLMRKGSESKEEGSPTSTKSTSNGDIKQIKADVQEIKSYLLATGKSVSRVTKGKKPSFVSKFAKGFFGGALNSSIPAGVKSYIFQRKNAQKISKPTAEVPVEKVPLPLMPQVAEQSQVQAKSEKLIPTAAQVKSEKNDDQLKAANTQTEVNREHEAKTTHDKLDKIIEYLEGLKKKSGSGGLGGLLMAAIAGLWNKIKPIWDVVKNLAKILGKVWSVVKSVGSTIARFAAKIGVKVGNLLKGLGEGIVEGVGAAEVIAGAGAGIITAGGALAIDRMAKYETDRAMEPAKGLEKYGLKALGQGKFILNGKPTTFDDLPDDYKHLVGAMTGDTRGGFSKKEQQYVKDHADVYKKLEVRQPNQGIIERAMPVAPNPLPVPKQIPDKLAAVSSENTEMKSQQSATPQVVVVKGGNTTKVISAPSTRAGTVAVVQTRNPESTMSRLTSSLFDDPAGYSNLARL